MKQICFSPKTGLTEIIEIPSPMVKPGHLLIQTRCSLISPGTEKMLIDFGKASIFEKIRQQPDKFRMVLDKVKTDGFLSTLEAVQSKLDQMIPLGYCNVGTVLAIGKGVEGFSIGDRVVSNGAHAEIVSVSKNLCCKIPDTISDEAASFTVLGAIALQGIRLANPTLGESFVVIGLGLIGLLTVQLLRAHGCLVLGIDYDQKKLALAKELGASTVNLSLAEDPIILAKHFSKQRGVDGVLITASTKSNDPIHHAAQMCRKKGRIILVGVTGLKLSRADFYEKELSFQVSCSYGPGRYDPHYENEGNDYPFGLVRWTSQRNFEAILEMMASHRISVESFITHRFALSDANQAYALLEKNKQILGILLEYKKQSSYANTIQISIPSQKKINQICVGFIGSGNYASRVLIPIFKKTNARLKIIACNGGISGMQAGKKFGFEKLTTDLEDIFSDSEINTVVIATRHNTHAQFLCRALEANKHVFVEKPLCITFEDLNQIVEQMSKNTSHHIMVGFNRRFSPHIQQIKNLLKTVHEPKSFIMTVNAGAIPATHWTQDPAIGGGRIIGEVCHFIDLLRYLAAAPITQYHVTSIDNMSINDDKVSIALSFADGSFGIIHYLANGNKSFPKERLEIFCEEKILQLDNFYKLRGFGWPKFKKYNLWCQDKGQKNCVQQFLNAITEGLVSPIPFDELIEVSRVTLEIAERTRMEQKPNLNLQENSFARKLLRLKNKG